MNEQEISVIYAKNNITSEKCELYHDYIQSFIILIFNTYMGDDICNIFDQKNHFKWCWKKNNENFLKEGIKFESNKLHKYFFNFMFEVFYLTTKKTEIDIENNNILKLWAYVFDYNNKKSKSDIDTLLEVYKLFEDSIKSLEFT